MILTCPISGIRYNTYDLANIKCFAPHPVFSLTSKQLLRASSQHYKEPLPVTDLWLLGIAMLRATKLVKFKHSAKPMFEQSSGSRRPTSRAINDNDSYNIPNTDQLSIISASLPALASILEFSATQPDWPESQHAYFPHLVIRADNAHLLELPAICNAWQESIADYHSGYVAARNSKIEAEKLNFLAHLSAFNSRKPTRYIKALARYTIDCLPSIIWTLDDCPMTSDHARYIISYAGLVHTLESEPEQPITKEQITWLQDAIIEYCNLDNTQLWKAHKCLEQLITEHSYSRFGANRFADMVSIEQESQINDAILLELGTRPNSGFIEQMRYDARAVEIKNSILTGI